MLSFSQAKKLFSLYQISSCRFSMSLHSVFNENIHWDSKKASHWDNSNEYITNHRSGVKTLYLWFHIFQETINWIPFVRSVLYWWKSDRIIFSNIQIHCYWCFELTIKISWSLWRVSLELGHFENILLVNHPVTTLWASFSWQNHISVKWSTK